MQLGVWAGIFMAIVPFPMRILEFYFIDCVGRGQAAGGQLFSLFDFVRMKRVLICAA